MDRLRVCQWSDAAELCNVQTRVFKGCREEILALTEVRGVKNNRVRACHAMHGRKRALCVRHIFQCWAVTRMVYCLMGTTAASDHVVLTAKSLHMLQARQLFKAGIRSPECIAKSSPEELAEILKQGATPSSAPSAHTLAQSCGYQLPEQALDLFSNITCQNTC